VALDPLTGEVRALVGGDRFPEPDRARLAYRTGSAVKTFYGALALDEGYIDGEPLTPLSRLNLWDCALNGWKPNDGEHEEYLGTREALARSSDCGAIAVAKSIGIKRACDEIVLSLQIKPLCSGPALIGGAAGSETTPLHMAEALAAFVNGGKRVEAGFTANPGTPSFGVQLFSPEAAFVELQMMRSVIGDAPAQRATAAMARAWSGLPKDAQLGAKTGTDTSNKFWIGVVQPHLVVAVVISIGSDKVLHEREGYTGGMIAGRVWANFVRRSIPTAPYYFSGAFQPPLGVDWFEVDRAQGCLQQGTGDFEVFLSARLPARCHGLFAIAR
jgi:membrane carboxypeptidase/penicillin-binding protein